MLSSIVIPLLIWILSAGFIFFAVEWWCSRKSAQLHIRFAQQNDKRALTGTEKVYLDTSQVIPGAAKVCAQVTFQITDPSSIRNGELSGKIRSALRKAQRSRELLCSHLDLSRKADPQLVFVGNQDQKLLDRLMPITDVCLGPGCDVWEAGLDVVRGEINAKFENLRMGPLPSLKLAGAHVLTQVKTAKAANVCIVVVMHHLICDGLSLSEFVGDVVKMLDGEQVDLSVDRGFHLNTTSYVQQYMWPSPVVRGLHALRMLYREAIRKQPFQQYFTWPVAAAPATQLRLVTHLESLTIPKDVFQDLRNLSRAKQVSINTLLSVLLLALAATRSNDVTSTAPVVMRTSIDLRRRSPALIPKRVLSYFVGNAALEVTQQEVTSLKKSKGDNLDLDALLDVAVVKQQVCQSYLQHAAVPDSWGWLCAKDSLATAVSSHLLENHSQATSTGSVRPPCTLLASNAGELAWATNSGIAQVQQRCSHLRYAFCSSVNAWQAVELTAATVDGSCEILLTFPTLQPARSKEGGSADTVQPAAAIREAKQFSEALRGAILQLSNRNSTAPGKSAT